MKKEDIIGKVVVVNYSGPRKATKNKRTLGFKIVTKDKKLGFKEHPSFESSFGKP